MSRFYASIQGNRGEATRMGTANSGIHAHPRGWDIGVQVSGFPFAMDKERDEFEIRVTGGSHGNAPARTIATVRRWNDGRRFVRLFGADQNVLTEFYLDPES